MDDLLRRVALLLLACAGTCWSITANASTDLPPLPLHAAADPAAVAAAVRHVRTADPHLTPSAALAATATPLPDGRIDFGYTHDHVWLRLRLVNDSAVQRSVALRTGVKFLRPLTIHAVQPDGGTRVLLHNDVETPFAERPLDHPFLVLPLDFAPGETRELLVHAASSGRLRLGLRTVELPAVAAERRHIIGTTALFAGLMLALGLSHLLNWRATRDAASLFFSVQIVAMTLYIAQIEGLAFQYLWPGSGAWNGYASKVLANVCNVSTFFFTVTFLRARQYTRIGWWVLCAVGAIGMLNLLGIPFMDARLNNQVALAYVSFGSLIAQGVAIVAWRNGHRSARFFLLGWALFAFGLVLYAWDLLGIISHDLNARDALKLSMVLLCVMQSYGLSNEIRELNRDFADTRERLVDQLQATLDETRERLRAEEDHARAEHELLQRERQIATASHDMHQPLAGLRLALEQLGHRADHRLLGAIDQVQGIIDDQLGGRRSATNATGCSRLLADLAATYGPLCREAGIDLRLRAAARGATGVPELVLKRMLGNALANTVHHSGARRVLLYARPRQGAVEFGVVDDGNGFDASRDPQRGLGLSIIRELADHQGLCAQVTSRPGGGCALRVLVPPADARSPTAATA